MRIAGALTILAVATLTGATAVASSSRRVPVVPCDDDIAWSKSGDDGGWRIVLGVVSVSAAHLRQVVATHIRPWAYWRKAGLSVHAGQGPVSASVATAWRSRVAITWGNTSAPSVPFGSPGARCNGQGRHGTAMPAASSSALARRVFR